LTIAYKEMTHVSRVDKRPNAFTIEFVSASGSTAGRLNFSTKTEKDSLRFLDAIFLRTQEGDFPNPVRNGWRFDEEAGTVIVSEDSRSLSLLSTGL
jgi:hypothetical protein